jgi:hypothetical protein
MGTAVGLVVLLLLVGLTAKFVHLGNDSVAIWVVIYLVLAAFAWQAWHEKDAPKSVLGWLGMAVGSVLVGAASFMVDVSFGHAKDPNLSMLAAAQEAGSIFGFALTATVFPALLLVSIAGMARSAYLSKRGDA